MQNQLYIDDYMIFDETTGHYVLTEKAIVERCAVDIRARLTAANAAAPEAIINRLCRTVSDDIYSFIHNYNIYIRRQDWLIAHNYSAIYPRLFSSIQRESGEIAVRTHDEITPVVN